jgi:hypothetical protein
MDTYVLLNLRNWCSLNVATLCSSLFDTRISDMVERASRIVIAEVRRLR